MYTNRFGVAVKITGIANLHYLPDQSIPVSMITLTKTILDQCYHLKENMLGLVGVEEGISMDQLNCLHGWIDG